MVRQTRHRGLAPQLLCGTALASVLASVSGALAATPPPRTALDIPAEPLDVALNTVSVETDSEILFAKSLVSGRIAHPLKGNYATGEALAALLNGTNLRVQQNSEHVYLIQAPAEKKKTEVPKQNVELAAATPASAGGIETVVVTAQHKSENIQQVPIAVSAFTQQQLTERQVAGGPDLVKEVPNLTFSKTNFTGYNIEIRGIGTQAISVTTDPAVAVAFNDIPFLRNHFFEQEFYDLADAEVLRGPQGTLYGRNATAGVVNIKSALPTDSYEAMLSADLGNYSNRRLEGMINIPIVGDTLDLRVAGEWTKRSGYSFNTITDSPIDGRDLWSGRMTLGWKPASNVQTDLIWEHFSEDDDRLRSGKQLCKTAPDPTEINGVPVTAELGPPGGTFSPADFLSQGCEMTSLYSSSAFEVPNGFSLPYYSALGGVNVPIRGSFDPYASTTQSTNLRDIESTINPVYRAKNDVLEFNVNYAVSPTLTFTSQAGYNKDFLRSSEDYNRFDTQPGAFQYTPGSETLSPDPNGLGVCSFTQGCSNGQPAGAVCKDAIGGCSADDGVFCDPQLGCSDRLVAEDLSEEHAWQASQEFRLSSNFSGPLNFSFGANFLHYETEENYYVFINTLTLYAYTVPRLAHPNAAPWISGVTDNSYCLGQFGGFGYISPSEGENVTGATNNCPYIDPNPISSLNGQGHNYFLSQNPYVLNSYAGFGEAYYNVSNNVKLTGGLRWTDDRKHFTDIPSELVIAGAGYPASAVVNQQWDQWTGRFAADWTPELDFTDQTLLYGSYAHGYKAGGANPPGAVLISAATPDHPLTFKPEHIEAFELGTKNTMLDGALTLNGDIFYYNYHDYQISEIVDRSAINLNFSAMVDGAELESTWEPLPGLKFNFSGGYENSRLANGSQAIDLMDRTAGNPNWIVVKPFVTSASNCILPTYVILEELKLNEDVTWTSCSNAYTNNVDPVTDAPYVPNPATGFAGGSAIPPGTYPGFNPATAPNNGEGFDKNLSGNQLPNAPHFTTSLAAEYSIPVSDDWAATLHSDFYWQSQSWARVFNDNPYDKLHGYSNVNVALILTSNNGWQVMGYVKNLFDVTAITGDFLNSDDSGLTTNVFLTDPRLFGVRVTKHLDEGDGFWGSDYSGYEFFKDLFADSSNGKPPLWIEFGWQNDLVEGMGDSYSPPFSDTLVKDGFASPAYEQGKLSYANGQDASLSYQPSGSDWVVQASIRYGRAQSSGFRHDQKNVCPCEQQIGTNPPSNFTPSPNPAKFSGTSVDNKETHDIVDFQIGKDVGLGMLGLQGDSTASFGIRVAQFVSTRSADIRADPDFYFPKSPILGVEHHHTYHVTAQSKRSFHGVGPKLSWDASTALSGEPENGEVTFDWGANAALLFGRQAMRGHFHTTGAYYKTGKYHSNSPVNRTANTARSRSIVVPNLGGMAGFSVRYVNAKISFGYRTDEFFGAVDGGVATRKSENLGFFGPFANISFGFGG